MNNQRRPKNSNINILNKLINRQIYGRYNVIPTADGSSKLISKPLARLLFTLWQVFPKSALQAGHIFLGFSQCGQFLLTYTQSNSLDYSGPALGFVNSSTYRLYWWVFIPYAPARILSEVTLFSDKGVPKKDLLMYVCQWPGDHSKILVYGYSEPEVDDSVAHCYLTITAIPTLQGCSQCCAVAASYGEDDVAAEWNGCVRLSCLRHGLTVHSHFEMVSPFPPFNPATALGIKNAVILNAGNFLHVLRADLELWQSKTKETAGNGNTGSDLQPEPGLSIARDDLDSEGTTEDEPKRVTQVIENLMKDWEVDDQDAEDRERRPNSKLDCWEEETAASVSIFSPDSVRDPEDTCSINSDSFTDPEPSCKERRNINSSNGSCSGSKSKFTDRLGLGKNKLNLAPSRGEIEYDFTEESPQHSCEKLSVFRKKRLAEKKYEFTDDNSENIVPPFRLPRRPAWTKVRRSSSQMEGELSVSVNEWEWSSLQTESATEEKVLRPYNRLTAFSPRAERSSTSSRKEILIEMHSVSRQATPVQSDCTELEGLTSPASSRRTETATKESLPKCVVHFKRYYIETDDELVSVITDIEEDDLGAATGYHNALPLAVHGTAYAQMQMVSSAKAEKVTSPCVTVQQLSLDAEQYCHEMAEELCSQAGKKYWFCSDFDLEILDVCQETGEAIVIATMLVEADDPASETDSFVTKETCDMGSQPHSRKRYEASFVFAWDTTTGHCRVIDCSPPESPIPSSSLVFSELGKESEEELWHPARDKAKVLRSMFPVMSGIYHMSNQAVMRGISLKGLSDPHRMIAIVLERP